MARTSIQRRSANMLAHVALAIALLISGYKAACAAVMENFTVANWFAGAYSNDSTGQFSHCAMSANYKSGITMLFSVTKEYQWTMGFVHPQWNLSPGASYDIEFTIDGSRSEVAKANAISQKQVIIALSPKTTLFEKFRHGYQLKIMAAGQQFLFNLDGTARALSAILSCTQRYVMASTAAARTDNPFVAQAPKESSDASATKAESTAMLANLLSQSGIAGFSILSPDQVPKEWSKYDVVWTAPNLVGVFSVLPPEWSVKVGDISSTMIASDARGCSGSFASGVSPDIERKQLVATHFFTACSNNNENAISVYTAFYRRAGGFYLLGSMTHGADVSPAKSADEAVTQAAFKSISH